VARRRAPVNAPPADPRPGPNYQGAGDAVTLDREALSKALRLPLADEKTQRFLALVEHDLRYITNEARKKPNARPRRRGRPSDDVARDLVVMFINRLEGVLGIEFKDTPTAATLLPWATENGAPIHRPLKKRQIGFSKSGGKLYEALQIYLAAAGRSMPDRHMPPPDDSRRLSEAEQVIQSTMKPRRRR